MDALHPHSPGKYVDGTVGAGGHAWGILERSAPDGGLLGLDVDPQALSISAQRLSSFAGRFTLVRASYTALRDEINRAGWAAVDGILLDLGVSSMQIDTPERGFSFISEGPLDMRLNPAQPTTAADLLNTLDETELARIIYEYGEEPLSRRYARAIVQARPLVTTRQLADVILRASASKRGRIHPATRTFQAVRIALNGELNSLSQTLPLAVASLVKEGRLAVISFHSLEDRIVKHFFQRESRDCICPPEQPVCTCNHHASIKLITRHPIEAGEEELSVNPRARSARLRVIEKL
ncbi:MAG: 16S rRNA (cytosine(1402)-N(4))-methyltransferase RsmH [Anaerolineae bacterium]|nr:16S rRNA (cytosine(1402)-N(4))-methyltransferase RsmH [Anaerolineae bacterium]